MGDLYGSVAKYFDKFKIFSKPNLYWILNFRIYEEFNFRKQLTMYLVAFFYWQYFNICQIVKLFDL